MILSMMLVAVLAADPLPVVSTAKVPAYSLSEGKGTATLLHNEATGSKDVAMSVLELSAGASVPEHVHETSGEWLYVIAGSATMTLAGKTLTLAAGDAVHIPKGVKHSAAIATDAATTFKAVQVYSPAGPEQRFKKNPMVQSR